MAFYHFSEEPDISEFVPRIPPHRPEIEPMVWAIDDWHAPLYYFPRDCPRIMLWPLPTTMPEDRERWFGASNARMIAYVEYSWLARLQDAVLYRYVLPEAGFVDLDDAGMFVCREAVAPLQVSPVGNLVDALRDSAVELRLVDALTPLRGVWHTTLHASGIRLRNAVGWDTTTWPARGR